MTACSAHIPSKQPDSVRLILPTVKSYTAAEQEAVARELQACGDKCACVKEFTKDYKNMRDETRAAIKQLTN